MLVLSYLHSTPLRISIFLQGLLLQDESNLPVEFKYYTKFWLDYHRWLKKSKITALEACINLVLQRKEISKIIIGIESLEELIGIVETKRKNINIPTWFEKIKKNIIDPRLWNSNRT